METIEILNNEVNDWWNELPSQVKDEIDIAIVALDNGNIVPHEEVKKMQYKISVVLSYSSPNTWPAVPLGQGGLYSTVPATASTVYRFHGPPLFGLPKKK